MQFYKNAIISRMLRVHRDAFYTPRFNSLAGNEARERNPVKVQAEETLKPLASKPKEVINPLTEAFRNFFGIILGKIAAGQPKNTILDLTNQVQDSKNNPVIIGDQIQKVARNFYELFENLGDAIKSMDKDRIILAFRSTVGFELEKFIKLMTPELASAYMGLNQRKKEIKSS